MLVLGCNPKKDGTPPPPPEPVHREADAAIAAAPPAGCTDRVARIDKHLHELAAATPGFMPLRHDITAPSSAAGKPLDTRGFVIGVTRDGKTSAQGQAFATTKDLGDYLDAMNKEALEKFAMAGGSPHDAQFPLYLWVDKDAPAATVASVLDAAAVAGNHWIPRLLVASTAPKPADPTFSPEVKAIADKLPPSEPDSTQYLAAQLRGAIGDCKPIIMALGTVSLEAVPQKEFDKLVKELPAGLATCECKVLNGDGLEWGAHVWLGGLAPALAWIDMPKVAKTDKHPIGTLVK